MAIIPDEEPPQGALGQVINPMSGYDSMLTAALVSAGLRGLSPGWGGPSSQLAGILGAGAQGASQNAAALQAQELNNRDFDYKASEAEANRASREREGEANRDTRRLLQDSKNEGALAVARERIAGLLQRTEMNLQKPGSSDIIKYRELARKSLQSTMDVMKLPTDQQFELIDREATRLYDMDMRAGRLRPPGTSQGAPGATAPGSGAPATEGAESPARTTQSPEPAKRKLSWEEVSSVPNFKELVSNPQTRAELEKRYPHLARRFKLWDYENTPSVRLPGRGNAIYPRVEE